MRAAVLNPASGDFRTPRQREPTVPTGTASFGTSNTTALSSGRHHDGGWTFNPGASAYTFTNNGQTLQFNGAGIVISGGSAGINSNSLVATIDFDICSTAGSATITNNSGVVNS